jgi:hypothetical protein
MDNDNLKQLYNNITYNIEMSGNEKNNNDKKINY